MTKLINMDVLDVKEGIIAHQCNAMGKMGAGLALAVKNKWPTAYNYYYENYKKSGLIMGSTYIVQVDNGLWVSNIIAQETYGKKKDIVYTDYSALRKGLEATHEFASRMGLQIYLPYKIGCGLANGDWNIVLGIITEAAPSSIICKK